MDDLISRAAARDVINTWGCKENEDVRMNLLHNDLNAIPAVDAVTVVRCKDCKHWWKVNELCTHQRHVHGTVCAHECKAMDYCSDGERRNSE